MPQYPYALITRLAKLKLTKAEIGQALGIQPDTWEKALKKKDVLAAIQRGSGKRAGKSAIRFTEDEIETARRAAGTNATMEQIAVFLGVSSSVITERCRKESPNYNEALANAIEDGIQRGRYYYTKRLRMLSDGFQTFECKKCGSTWNDPLIQNCESCERVYDSLPESEKEKFKRGQVLIKTQPPHAAAVIFACKAFCGLSDRTETTIRGDPNAPLAVETLAEFVVNAAQRRREKEQAKADKAEAGHHEDGEAQAQG
jgi:hypothetical protein